MIDTFHFKSCSQMLYWPEIAFFMILVRKFYIDFSPSLLGRGNLSFQTFSENDFGYSKYFPTKNDFNQTEITVFYVLNKKEHFASDTILSFHFVCSIHITLCSVLFRYVCGIITIHWIPLLYFWSQSLWW